MSIFGDRLYFELQDNGMEEQKKVNEGLVRLVEAVQRAFGRDERLPLPEKAGGKGSRAASLHPDGQEAHRHGPAQALHRRILFQIGRRKWTRAFSHYPGSHRQYACG